MISRLFVYGTLRHRPIVERLLGRPVQLVPAVLAGHRAAPIPGRPYPGLVVDANAVATGDVLVVSPADIDVLDAFEGDAYQRVDVTVTVDGVAVPAQTYRLLDSESASTGTWLLADFVAETASQWVRPIDPGGHHPAEPS